MPRPRVKQQRSAAARAAQELQRLAAVTHVARKKAPWRYYRRCIDLGKSFDKQHGRRSVLI